MGAPQALSDCFPTSHSSAPRAHRIACIAGSCLLLVPCCHLHRALHPDRRPGTNELVRAARATARPGCGTREKRQPVRGWRFWATSMDVCRGKERQTLSESLAGREGQRMRANSKQNRIDLARHNEAATAPVPACHQHKVFSIWPQKRRPPAVCDSGRRNAGCPNAAAYG